jgi:hypothetical protein
MQSIVMLMLVVLLRWCCVEEREFVLACRKLRNLESLSQSHAAQMLPIFIHCSDRESQRFSIIKLFPIMLNPPLIAGLAAKSEQSTFNMSPFLRIYRFSYVCYHPP